MREPPPGELPPTVVNQSDSPTSTSSQPPEGWRNAVSSIAANAKAAGQLVAKQAERTKLVSVSLPNAFTALGKSVYSTGRYREELTAAYSVLDGHVQAIKQLKAQAASQQKAQGLADKAKAAAKSASDVAQVKLHEAKAQSALTELGRAAFGRFGDQAGAPPEIDPIIQLTRRIEILDQDIAELSSKV